MEIRNNSRNLYFGSLITTYPAEKLLKKADKAVKASKAVYLDVNIPEGHNIPLWSVLSKVVGERQAANKNNIVIDVTKGEHNLLSIKTYDSKGFKHKEWIANPYPVTGSMREVFGDSVVIYGNPDSSVLYGKSKFFDAVDSAEFDVDSLKAADIAAAGEIKTSIKTLPKDEVKHSEKVLKRKESFYKRIIPHVQRPFAGLKKMITGKLQRALRESDKSSDVVSSQKLPRKMKKAARRLNNSKEY